MEVSGRRSDFAEECAAEDLAKLCEFCAADHVTTTANGICRECEDYMCNACFRAHIKVKSCRQHVLVDIASLAPLQRSAENVEKCNRHTNENIKYYCRKHETVGCGDCMIPVHGPCKPENIRDLSKQFYKNENFKSLLRSLRDLTTTNHENDKKVQENKKSNQIMLDKALQDIKSFRSQINNYLDKAEARIVKDAKDIERNNNKILAKLEQDCKLLSSKITEVRQKLNTELYQDNALFIQTVDCKPRVLDIERDVSRIQRENGIRTFEFVPAKQLQDIVTSIEKLGSFGKNGSESPTKPDTTSITKQFSRDDTAEHGKQRESFIERKEKGQEQAKQITVGARVRPIGDYLSNCHWTHKGQPGTVTAVRSDGYVSVKWDAAGRSTGGYMIGLHAELI